MQLKKTKFHEFANLLLFYVDIIAPQEHFCKRFDKKLQKSSYFFFLNRLFGLISRHKAFENILGGIFKRDRDNKMLRIRVVYI